jgi:F-type H+/Na+-transporting ATPase subunit alpha
VKIKNTDLVSLFKRSLKGLSEEKFEETGLVISVGDGICRVFGLCNAMLGELITFEKGNKGIIFDLGVDSVAIFLLDNFISVSEGEVAIRTKDLFTVPVGKQFIGRIVNAQGEAIDGLNEKLFPLIYRSIEAPVAPIIDRSPIDESLETGVLAIDALVPIGKGQRELIVGNRNTGKTSLVIDTILHQKGKNVVCIYVSIGQRQAHVAYIANILQQNGALDYTTIVSADASEAVLNQYLAPYTGCTLAEYLREIGHDVLIVYDNLSNHAISFREMSLLLRRPPGREAYPGDVFYLHSRLLERAGKLVSGFSITALPIVQIQSDDITAYIPTNLISITDGQIFLDTKLFNKGHRPAVNIELSVSRVGGAAQTRAVKKMTKALRLELAQYHELLDFAQFGSELDKLSQKRLARGERIVELLKQPQYVTYSFVDQALMLFLLKENLLDAIDLDKVNACALQFVNFMQSVRYPIYSDILQTGDISDVLYEKIKVAALEFINFYNGEFIKAHYQ